MPAKTTFFATVDDETTFDYLSFLHKKLIYNTFHKFKQTQIEDFFCSNA